MQRHFPDSCIRYLPSPLLRLVGAIAIPLLASALAAGSVTQAPWPVSGPDDTSCVAAAAYSGWYATGDTFEDAVEVRDIRGNLRRMLTRADFQAQLPWMTLDGGPDGPNALAWTATGRVLYILVTDDTVPGDGLGSDAVLKYDVPSDTLSVFARLDAANNGAVWPHLAMVHQKGKLYVGTVGAGLKIYTATANTTTAGTPTTVNLPTGTSVRGLTVDRNNNTLYMASESTIWRADLSTSPSLSFLSIVFGGPDLRAIAWADTYGGTSPSQQGLYILKGSTPSQVQWLTTAQAQGGSLATPSFYTTASGELHDLAATADGKLLAGADEDAVLISDTSDTRLGFDAWMMDEWNQHVTFARGLISPDGEPAGWVIDGDTIPSNPRFHPATPDGAGWTLLALVMNHHLTGDPTAQAAARTVLTRYAGLAPDNIRPVRSADGIYKHWLDPANGNTEGTWPDEYATLSTMKIVMGAARAMQHWPDDPQIALAASRIIFRVRNWDLYLSAGGASAGDESMTFKGLAGGGPDSSAFSRGFHEGNIFIDQAGTYGGTFAAAQKSQWFTWSQWPKGTFLTGAPIATASNGQFDAAFLSLYAALVSQPYRTDPTGGWRQQVANVRWSNAAWTDDNGPKYYTVFSAGTSPPPTGYNADSLANHPSNVTTFTSLLATCAFGETAEAVAGYAAYRKGARETFRTGASLLYRRSDTTPSFTPDSAGLPDVTLGGLGLAELIQPGSLDAVLARPYPTTELCPVDLNGDGVIDVEDLYRRVQSPSDLNGDGVISSADVACLRAWLRRHESTDTATR